MDGTSVADNLAKIEARIQAACRRVGRNPLDVGLIAVSKGQPLEKLAAAVRAGQRRFGENYMQESVGKMTKLGYGFEWHFIGALQSNKAKHAVGAFALIHSIDRGSVLAAVSKAAVGAGLTQDILIEVNLAGEASKGGVRPAELDGFLRQARDLPGVRVRGLMSLPPPGTAEQSRPYFRALRELLEPYRDGEFCELSMGTSQDFESAVEEGATLVRIGTEVFGARERRVK